MVQQYKAFWSIPNAGPSVSTFHADANDPGQAQSFADAVAAFFDDVKAYLPNEASLTFDTEVADIDTATGSLVGIQAVTPGTPVVGGSSSTWAAGAGVRVVWGTSVIVAGRRVRGSTFLVPTTLGSFNSSGTVSAGTAAGVTGSANDLLTLLQTTTGGLRVYSRPAPGRPGAISTVDTASVSDVPATLRSRKY